MSHRNVARPATLPREVPQGLVVDTAPAPLASADRVATPPPSGTPPQTWGWAVVEIRHDGTWGTPTLVPATGSSQTAAPVRALPARAAGPWRDLSPLMHAQVGALHATEGHLHLAAAALLRGTRVQTPSPGRLECLGRLAHVLAMQGELSRASAVASTVTDSLPRATGPGAEHARAAQAWVAVEHADFLAARDLLGGTEQPEQDDEDPWLASSVLLLMTQLLVSSGDPDAALRLLAGATERHQGAARPGWWDDVLTISRAEALLAAGEVQRSLAALTPMPTHAHAAASVLAATARHRIGDVRGARSVLAGAEEELDGEPLALQVEAWLLKSRLADDRGEHARADAVLDRALRVATSEELRLPLLHHWSWLRRQVDRDPLLLHAHREFLSSCAFDGPSVPRARTGTWTPDGPPAAALTEREEQVLELLAQMYSTEEIAGALFISVNTVKTHLKGIFGKLCVNRRVDAVRRGRQLGLC